MKIDDSVIAKIEEAFGFPLYDWQKDYILGKRNSRIGGRRNGNTFAYCVKLLLSDGEPIGRRELTKWADGMHGSRYPQWFAGYIMDINEKLINAGFKTRIMGKSGKNNFIEEVLKETRFASGYSFGDVRRICKWANYDKELAIKRLEYWPYEWPRNAMVKLKPGLFHHYVDIKEFREIEIYSEDGKTFDVNYPRYDIIGNEEKEVHFVEMDYTQISMLIFAYSEEEFERFEKALAEWRDRNEI